MMMSVGDVMRYVPGVIGASGREQPRPGHHPRQQLVGRLLRRRRARRRAVLPRPVQPRPRRSAEGTERDDLRPRRRRRRGQSRQPRKRASSPRGEFSLQGGMFGNKRVHGRTSTSRSATRSRCASNGMLENSDSFRDYVGLERYGVTPTLTVRAERSDQAHAPLRVPRRHARRRPRHHVLPGRARPTSPSSTYYGNPDVSHVRADVNIGLRPSSIASAGVTLRNHTLGRQLRSRLSELRARRRDGGQEPGRADRVQQRDRSHERLQPDRR